MPDLGQLEWHKDQFIVSTSQDLLQAQVVNEAFGSDYMYWTQTMTEEAMKNMLSQQTAWIYSILPKQIGLGRLITDQSSFAYLTDVFILPQYQGNGLGRWLMECINETLESWPDLRCAIIYAGGEQAQNFYSEVLGMKRFVPGVHGLEIMSKRGPGEVFDNV